MTFGAQDKNVQLKLSNLLTDGSDIEFLCRLINITTIDGEVWSPFGADYLSSLARAHKELRKLTLEIFDPEIINCPIDNN